MIPLLGDENKGKIAVEMLAVLILHWNVGIGDLLIPKLEAGFDLTEVSSTDATRIQ